MDAALQAHLMGGGESGNARLFGFFPDLEPMSLENSYPIGELCGESLLKKLLGLFMMLQKFILDFEGGWIFKTFIKPLLEMLKQQIDNSAGISGGGDVGHGSVSPSSGGSSSAPSGHEL